MIVRRHDTGGVASEAVYSPCETYRYVLTRTWDEALPRLAFVMLNPSTASELRDDPTVARCVARARAGGWGAVRICNLFALRETWPARLRAHPEPEGPGNDAALTDACAWADTVVAAWGNHGVHRGRGPTVQGLLRRHARALLHFGTTRAGQPRHPLYVSYGVGLAAWGPAPSV